MKEVRLDLDEPRSIYYAGQVLTGFVECESSEIIIYTAITVRFKGIALVNWTENQTEENNGVQRHIVVKYHADEPYFDITQCISGGNGPVQLPPGKHKIPFQFMIPSNVPSSFKGEQGSISYTVLACIRQLDRPPHELIKEFKLVAPMDLNKPCYNDVKEPIQIDIEEVYSCCCSSSPLSIIVRLPARGFCPGQMVPITVRSDNRASVEVNKIIFQLVKKECYHSMEPMSDYVPPGEVLSVLKTSPILGNSKRETTYQMRIPDMIAPNLQNCGIIDVGYFLKVLVKLTGCYDNFEEERELCIGLVPIKELIGEDPYIHPMESSLPQAPIPIDIPNDDIRLSQPNLNAYQTNTYPVNGNPPYPSDLPVKHIPLNPPFPASDLPGIHIPLNPPYPTSDGPVEHIPLLPFSNKIGFVMPAMPSHSQVTGSSPYPAGNSIYPTGNPTPPYPVGNTPYPIGNTPYPTKDSQHSVYSPSAPPPS